MLTVGIAAKAAIPTEDRPFDYAALRSGQGTEDRWTLRVRPISFNYVEAARARRWGERVLAGYFFISSN